MQTIASALAALNGGETFSAELTEAAIAAYKDPDGEGKRVFTRHYAPKARAAAHAADSARKAGAELPLLGLPISVKDLFDVKGEVTTAGSVVRRDEPPATRDAAIVERLRAAGAVIMGKTTMTEFAFAAIGMNPHYGTPANAWDRETRRIPGGSSSGAAVSVTDGMALAAIGTDTGGSVRIPAALNGLAGFKPTARRVPTEGAYPLSTFLDSVGPLAPTVDCCAAIDAVMAGEAPHSLPELPLRALSFGVPQDYVLNEVEKPVAAAFEAALKKLSKAGATIVDIPFKEIEILPELFRRATFPAAEAWYFVQKYMENDRERIDPRIAKRIAVGETYKASDLLHLMHERKRLIAWANGVSAPYDALLLPTVPRIAPPIAEIEADDDAYHKANLAFLRNPTVGNFLDRCAATVPCHEPGAAPVGLMVMGETLGDARCLAVAKAVEAVVSGG